MNPVELTPALAALPFPAIDPVAICLGPLAVRWSIWRVSCWAGGC